MTKKEFETKKRALEMAKRSEVLRLASELSANADEGYEVIRNLCETRLAKIKMIDTSIKKAVVEFYNI